LGIRLTKNNLNNYFSGGLVKVSILLSQLFLIPIFIKYLGVEKYGEWLIVTSIPNYLMVSDLGLSQTVTNEICKYLVKKKISEQQNLLNSSFSFLAFIGLCLIILFVLQYLLIDIKSILQINSFEFNELNIILGVYLINVIVFLLLRLILGYFKAIGKFYKHEYYLSLIYFIDFIFILIILNLKGSLILIPTSMLVSRILIFIIVFNSLSKYQYFGLKLTSKFSLAKNLLPVSLKLSFFSMGYALLIQGFTILIGIILGSFSVVIYNTLRTLTNSLKSMLSILYLPVMPELTILISNIEIKKAFKRITNLTLNVSICTFIGCITLYFLHEFILETWLAKSIDVSNTFLVCLLISIFLQTIWNSLSMVPLSINDLNFLKYFPIIVFSVIVILYLFKNLVTLEIIGYFLILIDSLMLILVYQNVKFIFKKRGFRNFI